MAFHRYLFISIIGFACGASAQQVVSIVRAPAATGQPIGYLSAKDWQEQGYIRVRALVDNPGAETCISPTTDQAGDNIFFEKKLDIVVTARAVGFANVDSSRDLPIAVYSWNGANYCKSAFQPPLVLVPYTPLRRRDDPNALNKMEPGMVLSIKSSAQSKERISSYATAALALSGELATGGAARSVAGLTNQLTGPVLAHLLDAMNRSSTTDQTLALPLSWASLVEGLPEVMVRVKRTTPQGPWYKPETVRDAVNRLQRPDEGIAVLNMRFVFDIRRSMLADEDQLDAKLLLPRPDTTATQEDNVLNFPKKNQAEYAGSLTVHQLLNLFSPSPLAHVASPGSRTSGCARLLNELQESFAAKVDLPVFFDASMKTISPQWNTQKTFYEPCLNADLKRGIEAYRGANYFGGFGVAQQPELALGMGPGWTEDYTDYLQRFRAALFSQEGRPEKFKALLAASTAAPAWPDSAGARPDPDRTTAEFFSSLPPSLKVGCMFAYQARGQTNLAMAVVNKVGDGPSNAYLLVLRPASKGKSLSENIEWIGLMDLTEPSNDSLALVLNQMQFGPGSVCAPGPNPRSAKELVSALRS